MHNARPQRTTYNGRRCTTMADDARPWRTMHDHGGRCTTMADDARPWRTMHDHGGRCTTMADDARPWWTMLDCVSVNAQLVQLSTLMQMQNNYFKIKYT